MIKSNITYYLLVAIIATLTSLFTSIVKAQNRKNQYLDQASAYKMKLGAIEITTFSDGSVNQELKKLLLNTTPTEIDRLTKENFQSDNVEASVNTFLFDLDHQTIMIDAGTSDLYGPSLGHLPENLRKAGIDPLAINAILITHIHTDHTGGLMDGNKMVFPNATVYISKTEVDFWMSDENYKNAPADKKVYFEEARLKVMPYIKAGKVKVFEFGKELFPGLKPINIPGHTPGHTLYELTSKEDKILFIGDMVHALSVQFPDPAVSILYDIDPVLAAQTREKIFALAAEKGYWVAAQHISFPGIGHIKKASIGYRWYPINYTTQSDGRGQ